MLMCHFQKMEGSMGSSVLPVEDGYVNYHLTNLLEHRINIDFLSSCSDKLLPPW